MYALGALPTRLLLPVRVLSRCFGVLFLTRLADAHATGRLAFFGELDGLRSRAAFAAYLAPLRKKWFVYGKPPFGGARGGARLSRSLHRPRRPLQQPIDPGLDDRGVTFRFKDYRRTGPAVLHDDAGARRIHQALPAPRAAQGVPSHRHYGLLASATCKATIAAEELIATPVAVTDPPAGTAHPHLAASAAADHRPPCPCCGDRMIIVETFGRAATPRPAIVRSRGYDRNDDARHCLIAQPACRVASSAVASLSPRRLRRRVRGRPPCRRSPRRRTPRRQTPDHDRRSAADDRLAHPLRRPPPRHTPIDGNRPINPAGSFLGTFGCCRSQYA